MDAVTTPPRPTNEPVHTYAPGTPERSLIRAELNRQSATAAQHLPHVIGGRNHIGTGRLVDVVQPHAHHEVLGTIRTATHDDARAAVDAALAAAPQWAATSFDERATVLLRAADLMSGPWRERIAAATMLGQSKSVQQAEIDAPCELVDFWRFNVAFAREILAEQPMSSPGVWNRLDHRPLDGFVYAITPFNFTAIAANLPTAPMLMGNTVIWKPSPTQAYAAAQTMELLRAAGLPDGVINLVHGDGKDLSDVVLADPNLAGIHFTGSTATFQHLWREVGSHIDRYRNYPRLVGETGGKDFIVAHASADPEVLRTALIRGAFEYQGQKCSAASRAYVARSVWDRMGDDFLTEANELAYGDIRDLSNFGGALIDRRAFDKNVAAIDRAKTVAHMTVATGGGCDDSTGYFVRPTVLLSDDPTDEAFATEYFGPILAVHVYDDASFDDTLRLVDTTAKYALTGSIIATDLDAAAQANQVLRHAAGNFYINDKPTGAVVGQQPFGGARGSGTNDKAGSKANLMRWTSTRTIKETFVPPTSSAYPHMETDPS
ncbi:L-glutamate gamma-semialdehyde dehydrogenase [Gordonia sp. HNM0687]|uniref:L-glutamate gamma-semialdehyde dehydrogenase n=1 Tax=Gordonia mangrovi TaxID=2665643 RepID=A0A6L7GS98_9ACTN|nr:L-glutamate gamma-semialdehyde dehydrogenase [Gordonia mangrovi]MXP22740.1 L-glutamate gamma-semialdehyde dehydrogenase [Gordonia mangrovi]UVF77056.1 L-glutamate gamma-semialdehyde dehydrogenase [Gordonia mangrovi]